MSRRKKNTNANTEASNTQGPVEAKVQVNSKVAFVKMVNDDGKEANVHPQEVDNYAKGGFKAV